MADQASKDAAAKERIIKHMNEDHQRSLSYYLQHYCRLSSRAASKATLSDISLTTLTLLDSYNKTHKIPFDPPMTSYAEVRPRVVEMDRESRAALGISSISITEYSPPSKPVHITIFALCALTFVIFTTQQHIQPGTFVYDRILPWFPGGPKWFLGLSRSLALPVLGIHTGEAYLLDRKKLRKYGVERGTALWWKWTLSCFIEGFGCFQRIDEVVKAKEIEAEKAKH
jgi:hypothetical protein